MNDKPAHKFDYAAWSARAIFFIVFGWNILCALQFISEPETYMSSYQLTGIEGATAVRGLGVAFLMWNATYPLFILRPRKWPILGWIIVVQQLIGLIGESLIVVSLPANGYEILAAGIMRFVIFDAIGFVLMIVALFGLRIKRQS